MTVHYEKIDKTTFFVCVYYEWRELEFRLKSENPKIRGRAEGLVNHFITRLKLHLHPQIMAHHVTLPPQVRRDRCSLAGTIPTLFDVVRKYKMHAWGRSATT